MMLAEFIPILHIPSHLGYHAHLRYPSHLRIYHIDGLIELLSPSLLALCDIPLRARVAIISRHLLLGLQCNKDYGKGLR
jgi:hypothetical protein